MSGKHRRHEAEPVQPDLPITPMLDMTFQLLAFFVFTFRPQSSEAQISMTLPEDKGGGQGIPDPTNPSEDIMVTVQVFSVKTETPDGKVAYSIKRMVMTVEEKGPQATPKQVSELKGDIKSYQAALQAKYDEVKKMNRPIKLQLEISGNLSHEYVVQLFDTAKFIGYNDIAPMVLPAEREREE